MNSQTAVAILNELLACEQGALAPRLFESTVFVSKLSIKDWRIAKDIAAATRENCATLADLTLRFGGTPGHRIQHVSTADLHFQELRHALPRLIADHESLMRKYRKAVEHLGSRPEAAGAVSRILQQHQQELEELQSIHGETSQVTS